MLDIRVLTGADAAQYWALRLEALEGEPRAFGASVDEHRRTTIAAVAAKLESGWPNSFLIGGFEGARLCAMAGFVHDAHNAPLKRGHVFELYVSPVVRGRGVGRHLLDAVLERARTMPSLEWVVLGVGSEQVVARRLYLSLGFQPFGIERNAIRFDGGAVDEEFYALKIGR